MEGCMVTRMFLLTLIIAMHCVTVSSKNDLFGRELFGTKTPYLWSRQSLDVTDLTSVRYNGQTCRVVYVDGVYRHGARYPSLKWINRMDKLHELLGSGNEIDRFVMDWVNAFTADKAAQLSALGQQEMFVLGERLASRFQSFLSSDVDRMYFYSSTKARAKDSATYFQKGLSSNIGVNLSIPTTVDNLMLRFYDTCKRYNNIMDNEKTFEEYEKFLTGPEMTNVVADVNKAVLHGHFNLSVDQVEIIQQICAFELGFFNTSDWCSYLSTPGLQLMDYAGDIESYIEGGYRHKVTAQMSCPLLKHVFQQMDKVVTDQFDSPIASFRFGHSETVSPVYTALGLFNGSASFLATDYQTNAHRQFRTSVILPFSANLVTTLYKCGTEYVVKMMVNEEEVDIPACGAAVCPFTTVKEHYAQFVNCDFDQVCGNKETNTGTVSRIEGSAMIAIVLFLLLFQ